MTNGVLIMKKLLIPVAILSTNLFATVNAQIGYGVMFPASSKSNLTMVLDTHENIADTGGETGDQPVEDDSTNNTAAYEYKLANSNYFDVGFSESDSGLGLLYSATVKNTDYKPVDSDNTNGVSKDNFYWNYKAVYLNFQRKFGDSMHFNIALGTAKQTFGNSNLDASATTTEVSKNDISGRAEVAYVCPLSKTARLNIKAGYHYFKVFKTQLVTGVTELAEGGDTTGSADANLVSATPAIKPSAFSASVAVEFDL